MKRLGLFSVALGVCIFSMLYLIYSSLSFDHTLSYLEEEQDLQQAKELLAIDLTEDALALIASYRDAIEEERETGRLWLDLLLTAYTKKGDKEHLVLLHEYSPEAFIDHEDAVLLVANSYLESSQLNHYQSLRSYWRGYEEREEEWFTLDADRLIRENRREEALKFLNSQTFSGKADVGRLLRLASLHREKEAWNYLLLAQKKDPHNPDVLLAKGNFLEAMGNKNAALSEYRELVKQDPHNPEIQQTYANFLIRGKYYKEALNFWEKDLSSPSSWVNSLFWSRISSPIAGDLKHRFVPDSPYVHYLLNLRPGEFWNKEKFSHVLGGKEILQRDQTAFWLTLLSALKQENDREAWALIQNSPFIDENWNPEVLLALQHLLAYRGAGKMEVELASPVLFDEDSQQADGYFPMLATLAKHAQPGQPAIETTEELDAFLHNREAVAAIFLVGEWNEAALSLYPLHHIKETSPDWVIVSLVKALQQNRGGHKALEFAALHVPRAGMTEAVQDLLLTAQLSDHDMERIHALAEQNSDLGFRCAKIISQAYWEGGKHQAAKRMIYSQKRLVNHPTGKELLARIALKEGDKLTAEKLYSSIVSQSIEAKSFWAKKAFSERDWQKARELTEDLLKQFPENPTLQQNMRAILSHQQ